MWASSSKTSRAQAPSRLNQHAGTALTMDSSARSRLSVLAKQIQGVSALDRGRSRAPPRGTKMADPLALCDACRRPSRLPSRSTCRWGIGWPLCSGFTPLLLGARRLRARDSVQAAEQCLHARPELLRGRLRGLREEGLRAGRRGNRFRAQDAADQGGRRQSATWHPTRAWCSSGRPAACLLLCLPACCCAQLPRHDLLRRRRPSAAA
jgi:hypothetical protein